jgi:NADPH:quinone reductase-like Zn-dependent oxidoreductase
MSSSFSVPKTMRALLTAGAPELPIVQIVPTPKPGPGQLLIKVTAVALNPTDKAHADKVKTVGLTIGVDCAGTVVGAAPDVTGFQPDERVAAFVHGALEPGVGTMAEYVVAYADLVWRVPDNLSLEEASTMNCGSVYSWAHGSARADRTVVCGRPSRASTTRRVST